jgi:type I restriction-modification system DNA methylase subunit
MMRKNKNKNNGARKLTTQQSVNSLVWSICDIMRRSNCAGAMQYVPELTWILFLRILDEREAKEAEMAEAVGASFSPSLEYPCRWQDWAAPDGTKRQELQDGALGAFFGFVNGDLFPYLRGLGERPNASPRQKVISQIMSGIERVHIDTERNLLDVLDKVHDIFDEEIDPTHIFPLSQVYEGLLLKMGEKGNDGGQFFTKGKPTERVWYYDLSDIKVGKRTPFTLDRFDDFFRLLPDRADSERSWTVTREEIEAKNFDLKAFNPNAKTEEDTRTPEELLDLIEAKGREVAEALAALRQIGGGK